MPDTGDMRYWYWSWDWDWDELFLLKYISVSVFNIFSPSNYQVYLLLVIFDNFSSPLFISLLFLYRKGKNQTDGKLAYHLASLFCPYIILLIYYLSSLLPFLPSWLIPCFPSFSFPTIISYLLPSFSAFPRFLLHHHTTSHHISPIFFTTPHFTPHQSTSVLSTPLHINSLLFTSLLFSHLPIALQHHIISHHNSSICLTFQWHSDRRYSSPIRGAWQQTFP